MGGLIVGVWLTLIVGAPGFGALSGVLVKLDGGALVLVGAGPFGGLGGEEVLLSFSSVAFRSVAKFACFLRRPTGSLLSSETHPSCVCCLALATSPSWAGL